MTSITRINVKTVPKAAEAKKGPAATPVDEKAMAAAGEASEAVQAASAGQAASVEEVADAARAEATQGEAAAIASNDTPVVDQQPATETPVTAEPPALEEASVAAIANKVNAKPVDDRLWRAIAVGDVVLMADYSEGEFQGWWPAKVITLVEGRASCVYIDYEEMGHFSRQITELALLHPMHAG